MSVSLNFDAESVAPATPFEVLPKGKYPAMITASEMKDAASGNGQYIQFEYTIIDGDYTGRKLWSRHNIQHTNATAEEIGRRELSAICHACGVLKVTDSAELHDIPLTLEVGIEKNKQTNEDTNRVRAWIAVEGAVPKAVAKPAPKAGTKAPPPWARSTA